MNIGFYGHTNTMVFTFTDQDGKFNKVGVQGGMRQIYASAQGSIDAKEISIGFAPSDPNDSTYRRDYYGLRSLKSPAQKTYYASRPLGYEDGEGENNIFAIPPENANTPPDVLFVWDEGYGGLQLPTCKAVYWASNMALPDREQFDRIAGNCLLFLDGEVLRKAGAMISRQISWERTTSELITELQQNLAINYLLKARCLLFSFGTDGAVLIMPDSQGQMEASLILTHGDIEGAIADRQPGQVADVFVFLMMATTLFSSATAFFANNAAVFERPHTDMVTTFLDKMVMYIGEQDPLSASAIKSVESDIAKYGVATRAILESGESISTVMSAEGTGLFDAGSGDDTTTYKTPLRGWPAVLLPLEKTATSIYLESEGWTGWTVQVPDDWTIIGNVGDRQLSDVAFEYVQNGATAIEGLPKLSLGALTTVDRREIEAYQNIRNLILDYAHGETTRPLSIAVFGSPGSGKSFGVTQIAQNILPGKIEKLEFNVSQFTSLSDLGVAFQKVRDTILGGKLPLVFFDEFDSDRDGNALGWLKNFLMPMQDGKFKDESGEHPLGRCILVFAGGTAATFGEFINPQEIKMCPVPHTAEDIAKAEKEQQAFKNVKGPDFVSRLRGTIDVLGPNPKDDTDKNFIIRRALLLRSLVERNSKLKGNFLGGMAPVNDKIIRAMLHVPEYKHGARSMEAILDMSRIDGNTWEPVSLPSHSQLALHVDADAFIKLVLGN